MVPSPNETLRPLVARLGRPSPRCPIPSRSDMVKLFLCQHCQQTLLFENTRCERCGHQLGYLPDRAVLSAVEPKGATWIALASPHQHHRFCANWKRQGCNWMVSAASIAPWVSPIFTLSSVTRRHRQTWFHSQSRAAHVKLRALSVRHTRSKTSSC
jgi:hypothetical protein